MTKDKLHQLTGDERLGQQRESEYLGAEDIDDDKEKVSYTDTMASWGDKFGSLSDKFTNFSLDHTTAAALKNIDKNTSAISKNLSDEDLKYLEDVAIRKYERNSSVTLAPQIKVVMQGSADKSAGYDVGNAIAEILARQAASHTSLTT